MQEARRADMIIGVIFSLVVIESKGYDQSTAHWQLHQSHQPPNILELTQCDDYLCNEFVIYKK